MASQFQVRQEEMKSIPAAISELKADIINFLNTRYQLLLAEMKEKLAALKFGLPLLLGAAFIGTFGLAVLTGALVYAISLGLGVGWSLLLVGGVYMMIAGGFAWIGWGEIAQQSIQPKRTLEVLQQDQAWLQQEARSA